VVVHRRLRIVGHVIVLPFKSGGHAWNGLSSFALEVFSAVNRGRPISRSAVKPGGDVGFCAPPGVIRWISGPIGLMNLVGP
jgi:hypothetical protein